VLVCSTLCGSFIEDFSIDVAFCVTASPNTTCRSISSSSCLCNFLTCSSLAESESTSCSAVTVMTKKLRFQLKSFTDLLLELRPVQPHPGSVALFSPPTTIALTILKRVDQQNHPDINSIGRNQSMNRETTRLLLDHTACG
jgi:hypothetical protein